VFDFFELGPLIARLQLHAGAGIGQTMHFPYEVTGAGADVTMTIPALNPASTLRAPQGTTHFELVSAASSLTWRCWTFTNAVVAAPLGILPRNSPALVNQTRRWPASRPLRRDANPGRRGG
jgi:hypothetical protein